MTSNKKRPPIPNPLKRELRQEAHFGCVNCGNPIIEYHHITPWTEVKEHTKDNLVVLCPLCHHKANCGDMNKEIVLRKKANPVNKLKVFVNEQFFLTDYDNIKVKLASNTFIHTPKILIIKNEEIITLDKDEFGNALLSAKFYNKEGLLIAQIINNEWFAYLDKDFWDIQYSPGFLKIHNKPRDIALELHTKGDTINIKADLYYQGAVINLDENQMTINNEQCILTLINTTILDCHCGIRID